MIVFGFVWSKMIVIRLIFVVLVGVVFVMVFVFVYWMKVGFIEVVVNDCIGELEIIYCVYVYDLIEVLGNLIMDEVEFMVFESGFD